MDTETFEKLLETARWLRQRRHERLARLGLRRRTRRAAAPDAGAGVDVRSIRAVTGLSQAKFAELLSIEECPTAPAVAAAVACIVGYCS